MQIKAKRPGKTALIAAELGVVAGVIVAFYTLPGQTPARVFWSAVLVFVILIQEMLFFKVQK